MKYIITTNEDGTYTLYQKACVFSRRKSLGRFCSLDAAKNHMQNRADFQPQERAYDRYGNEDYGY
jgi:hypothetical protein